MKNRTIKLSILILFGAVNLAGAEDNVAPRETLVSKQSNREVAHIDLSQVPLSGANPLEVCESDWQDSLVFIILNWYTGNERYAVYQDPSETGCIDTYPFQVTDVKWLVRNVTAFELSVIMRPTVRAVDTTDPLCTSPGEITYEGPLYDVRLPPGNSIITLPMNDSACVIGPYFAGVECPELIGPGLMDLWTDSASSEEIRPCASWNDYSGHWEDLAVDYPYPGNLKMWSSGINSASNSCVQPLPHPVRVYVPIGCAKDSVEVVLTVPDTIIEYNIALRHSGVAEVTGFSFNNNILGLTERTLDISIANQTLIHASDTSFDSSSCLPAGTYTLGYLHLSPESVCSDLLFFAPTIDSVFDDILTSQASVIYCDTNVTESLLVVTGSILIGIGGDANDDGSFNVADVTFGIARIFDNGPAPVCQDKADANGDNSFNIADVTYGIARIFSGGPAPVCGNTGN